MPFFFCFSKKTKIEEMFFSIPYRHIINNVFRYVNSMLFMYEKYVISTEISSLVFDGKNSSYKFYPIYTHSNITNIVFMIWAHSNEMPNTNTIHLKWYECGNSMKT